MKYNKTLFQPAAEATGKGKSPGLRTKQKLKVSGRHWSWGHSSTQEGRAMAMAMMLSFSSRKSCCWETQATEHSLLPRPELEVVTEVPLGKFSGR